MSDTTTDNATTPPAPGVGNRGRDRRLIAAIGAVMLLALIVLAAVQSSRDATGEPTEVGASAPENTFGDFGVRIGAEDARVLVTVYEDFLCPACADFETQYGPALDAYLASGQVAVEYRMMAFLDTPDNDGLSTRSMNAFAAVLDVHGPDVASEFHDAILHNPPPQGTPVTDDDLLTIAELAGADRAEIAEPVKSGQFFPWVLNATDAASKDGVNQTPSIALNGDLLTLTDGPTLSADIDAAIADAYDEKQP